MQLTQATTTHGKPPFAGFGEALKRVLIAPITFLAAIGEASARAREANFLMHLTDAELAARGLRRGDIPAHVFRDKIA